MTENIRGTSDGVVYELDDELRYRVSAWVDEFDLVRLRIEKGDGRFDWVQMTPAMAAHLADVLHDCAMRGAKPGKRKAKKKGRT